MERSGSSESELCLAGEPVPPAAGSPPAQPAWGLPVSRPALLFVLSGPSGVGKDAVLAGLRSRGVALHYTITATTRAPRPGEVDGVSYHFWSPERFLNQRAENRLLECAEVHGHHYGTPLDQVRDALQAGKDVILNIDVQGAAQVKKRSPEAVFIFLAPPSLEHLVGRLRRRGTETDDESRRRLRDAEAEMQRWTDYDYLVINHDGRLNETVERVEAIILAEQCRTHPRRIAL